MVGYVQKAASWFMSVGFRGLLDKAYRAEDNKSFGLEFKSEGQVVNREKDDEI